jgi:dTDP-4-dehydrorhamnose reductase
MVFSGGKNDPGPYDESHSRHEYKNLTWYGASKSEGEKLVLKINPKNAVVRIIYPVRGEFDGKLDYARKILALQDDGKLYPMFFDQFMNVTYIDELANALGKIIESKQSGVYHVAANDITTPYEFASTLIKKCRGVKVVVKKTSFKEFIKGRDLRRYPQFGGLNVGETEEKIKESFSSCEEIISELSLSLQKR